MKTDNNKWMLSKDNYAEDKTEICPGKYTCGIDIEEGSYMVMASEPALFFYRPFNDSGNFQPFMLIEPGRFQCIRLRKGDVIQCDKALSIKRLTPLNSEKANAVSDARKNVIDTIDKWVCGNVDLNVLSDPALDLLMLFLERYPKKLIADVKERLYGIEVEYVSSASDTVRCHASIDYNA